MGRLPTASHENSVAACGPGATSSMGNRRGRASPAGSDGKQSFTFFGPPAATDPYAKLSIRVALHNDPLLPDDVYKLFGGFLIRKLTDTVTWAPAAARPELTLNLRSQSVSNEVGMLSFNGDSFSHLNKTS